MLSSNCCLFGEHGFPISNVFFWLFTKAWSLLYFHLVADLISCVASVSSKFCEDISDGMHQASSQLSRWFTIVKSWHLSRIFSAWSLCCIELLFIRCSEMKRHSWLILVFSLYLFSSLRSCPLCLQGKKMFKPRLLSCCLGCLHLSFFITYPHGFFFIDITI